MHKKEGLEAMGEEVVKRSKAITGLRGLDYEMARDFHLLPGNVRPRGN